MCSVGLISTQRHADIAGLRGEDSWHGWKVGRSLVDRLVKGPRSFGHHEPRCRERLRVDRGVPQEPFHRNLLQSLCIENHAVILSIGVSGAVLNRGDR